MSLSRHIRLASVILATVAALASTPRPASAKKPPTAADARAFAARAEDELKKLYVRQQTAEWIKNTYITDDTERNAAGVNQEVLAYLATAVKEAAAFSRVKGLDADTTRQLYLLKLAAAPLPAPDDAKKREELTTIAAKLEGMYGKGKWCGPRGDKPCRDLQELSNVLAKSRDPNELLDAWVGWHTISRPMRPMFTRLVELANAGAGELGFANLGALWLSGYDMLPADFEVETERLWQQVKPLYDQLHCYVRARLSAKYGADKVPEKGPIPADLLGNMWAQEWNNIYPLVEPYPNKASLDVDGALKKQGYDEVRMVKLGESFFTSLGLDPLPASFWTSSMLKKPRDRDVVCHASAWDVTYAGDLRIKMCIEPKEEDLVTIDHELGHDYYYQSYFNLPVLYQQGANDGFHEAIGDALTLSITPGYLKQVGLVDKLPTDEQGLIDVQMKMALDKVAFLPFGKLIDQFRWDVFSGKTKPEYYNQAWWDLRMKYQGVAPPIARTEEDFDAGAKYHIAASVPYLRYFLARILQFQFHRALCKAAGFTGPLHECSIYGNKAAGAKLRAMLALGASQPWPRALEALTGEKTMDASALLDYFAPLKAWLEKQNQGKTCGW